MMNRKMDLEIYRQVMRRLQMSISTSPVPTETSEAITDFLFIGKEEKELSVYDLVIVCGNEQTDETCADLIKLMDHVKSDAVIVFSGRNHYFVEHRSGYTQTLIVENKAGNTLENFSNSLPLIERIKPLPSFGRILVVCKAFLARRAKMCALSCGYPAEDRMDFFGTVSGKRIEPNGWFKDPDTAKRVMEEVERIGKYFVKGDLSL